MGPGHVRIRSEYDTIMARQPNPVIVRRGDLYIAYIEELPGVKAQGKTAAEARRNLEEAIARVSTANWQFAARLRSQAIRRGRKRIPRKG
jgi:hypothetical protein